MGKKMEAKIGQFFESVSNFFIGADQIPWCGRDIVDAAEILAKEGISAEVINLRSIRPLNRDTINASVRKTNRLVTLEEGFPQHGVGAEICASVVEESFGYLDAPVERISRADVPMLYAANLERNVIPQIEDIVRAAKRVCYIAVPMAAAA